MELDSARLCTAVAEFPLPSGVHFSYGTSGFRTDASLLESVAFRVGILTALRSVYTRCTIGLMITASHNPIQDNGVKVADPNGDMLSQDWEPFAEALANADEPNAVLHVVVDFIRRNDMHSHSLTCARVLVARDTRPSGEKLLNAARYGVEVVGGRSCVLGILTTPQLHWMVRAGNRGLAATEGDYFSQLSSGFSCLLEKQLSATTDSIAQSNRLIVDGANGVGASKLLKLASLLSNLKLEIKNCGQQGEGALNELVGADFVQKERKFPRGFGDLQEVGQRCASLDGDADRIVFFYREQAEGDQSQNLLLLDGDKILALFAMFIQQQVQELSAVEWTTVELGVVQTAYANGASTRFLTEKLVVPVVLTPTGVKHLHHKAAQYDIGLYFEANGHGTVLFKDAFLDRLRERFPPGICPNGTNQGTWTAAQRLLAVSEMVNQAIGDALSVLLFVEAVLQYYGWSIQEWDSIYADLPSRQLKVKVQDRAVIKTTNAETIATHPVGLQAAIDAEVGKIRSGRAFVRPSGTENIVRVYAEAETQDDADCLARAVAVHVYKLANGVGASP